MDISKNQIGNQGAEILAKVLARSRDIISLKLSNNALNKHGGEVLIKSLAYNQSLIDFDISSLDAMR